MFKACRVVMVCAAVAGVVLASCGSDGDSGSGNTSAATSAAGAAATTTQAAATTAAAASGTGLTIKGFEFSEPTVKAGEAFTITNEDSANHTVTADDGSFSVPVSGGSTAQLTIPTAGTYAIHCNIHSSMHGTIVAT
jgi:plastocyanin